MEAKLQFTYNSERKAEAIVKAVSPDNIQIPNNLSIETTRVDKTVLTTMRCKKSLSTFIATLDDLLECIAVAENTCKTIKTYIEPS